MNYLNEFVVFCKNFLVLFTLFLSFFIYNIFTHILRMLYGSGRYFFGRLGQNPMIE